jgi:hypothetical protein
MLPLSLHGQTPPATTILCVYVVFWYKDLNFLNRSPDTVKITSYSWNYCDADFVFLLLNMQKEGYNHMWRSKNVCMEYWLCVGWTQLWPNTKVSLASWHNNNCIILFLLFRYNMACAIKSIIRNYSDVTSIQWRKHVLPAFGRCRVCDRFLQHDRSQKGTVHLLHVLISWCTIQLLRQFLSSLSYGLFMVQTAHSLQLHIYGFPWIKHLVLLRPQDVTVIATQPSLTEPNPS